MSLERVRAQLGKFGLAKPNDEMAVTVQSLSHPIIYLAIQSERPF